MTRAQNTDRPKSRSSSTVAAFLFGVPLAVGVLALIAFGPNDAFGLKRYVEHPVENVEVVLFCCALGALGSKMLGYTKEKAACGREMLPSWNGESVPVSDAPRLRAAVQQNAGRLATSWLARRLDAVLEFTAKRGSAEGLDDQLRALADTDALALDNSYSLIRFITWAIPILGFLGTVLGITKAIAAVKPEDMENINKVTSGLALAFDTTAVALALTMLTMFLSFVVERLEQSVLEHVDHYVEVELAHRFERAGAENGNFVTALQQNTRVLLQATEKLVQQQASVWANALAAAQQQWADSGQRQQQQLTAALEAALDKTLSTHQARLGAWEQSVSEHQASLAQVIEAVAGQTDALAHLQEDSKQLVCLQDALHQNLAALQGAGAFEQAVQSLTAAIHLLTAKASPGGSGPSPNRLGVRPGAAA
jgi:biopolymer transport protein ExbB/TolQ